MILAGDIGGTNVRFALFDHHHGVFVRKVIEKYQSNDFADLPEAVLHFLKSHSASITSAAFGVPGPIIDGMAHSTNLPWRVDSKMMARALTTERVKVVNDLVAMTAAIPYLRDSDVRILHAGEPDKDASTFAVVAPGTGLGQGYLHKNGPQFSALPSEGGHADFAPNTLEQVELLSYLMKKFGHVSFERVLSGPGLLNIYAFLKETGKATEPSALQDELESDSPGKTITRHALSGEYEICVRAVDLFAQVLGAQAGNMVLTLMATGGIYLGGGIVPQLHEHLTSTGMLSAYLNKGRLSYLVEKTPLKVICDDTVALTGAASFAAQKL
ncbi:glucokinase [candidate division KSB1 bacterium]|nr:glucokinase [candidate division KSB1 bacterium]